MADDQTSAPNPEGLTNEQKLGLALVSLLTPVVGYAAGGKSGAMAGAQAGFTAAGGAAGDIAKTQEKDAATAKATTLAETKYQRERADRKTDAIEIDKAKKDNSPEKSERQVINGQIVEKQDDGTWKPVYSAPDKPEKTSKVQQTQLTDKDGNPLVFDPNSGQYSSAGAPEGAKKPGSEPKKDQYTAATFGRRVEQAEQVFADLTKSGYNRASYGSAAEASQPIDAIKDPHTKMQAQAERNFVNAILRRESGAAISPAEFDSAEKQYFPRAGDTPDVLTQKAANRQQAMIGLKAEAGAAWEKVPLAGPAPGLTPSSKPKRVIQGGVEYLLNEKTGEYE